MNKELISQLIEIAWYCKAILVTVSRYFECKIVQVMLAQLLLHTAETRELGYGA